MQTGTKKTPDRFQNYFCPVAANDIVHHAYAWIVKEPNMQPKFLYCRAIDDPANDRGWNIIAEVWERDVLGGWGISSSTIHPEFEDTADGYALAEGMPGTAASLPYQVFREVVNEHDTNYLIALAIAIDALPKDSTCDMASETIRANADVISQMRNTQEFMDANTPDDYKLVAVKVGYNFALVPKIELSGIETNATETIVDISGKQYGLLAGRTFEDSQKLDAVLDMFPEYAIKDYKVPNKISVFIMPVQMYWKDDPSEIIETNFSFEDTCGLIIDDSVTFSGYTQNELVDMIGREDNGEDFVITGVGAGHYVGTCKKEPSKNKSVSEKTCNARESSGRLDADRNVDRNDIAKDKEVK